MRVRAIDLRCANASHPPHNIASRLPGLILFPSYLLTIAPLGRLFRLFSLFPASPSTPTFYSSTVCVLFFTLKIISSFVCVCVGGHDGPLRNLGCGCKEWLCPLHFHITRVLSLIWPCVSPRFLINLGGQGWCVFHLCIRSVCCTQERQYTSIVFICISSGLINFFHYCLL